MTGEKPITYEEYCEWLAKEHRIADLRREATYYETVVSKVKRDFEGSRSWDRLGGAITDIAGEYYLNAHHQLMADQPIVLPTLTCIVTSTYPHGIGTLSRPSLLWRFR